jgi:uncharacterized membrane protein (UPF0182 family)
MLQALIFLAFAVVFALPLAWVIRSRHPKVAASVWLLVGIFLYVSLQVATSMYPDILWFEELGQTAVYWTVFWAKVKWFALGLIAAIVFMSINIRATRTHISPDLRKSAAISLGYRGAYFVASIVALVMGLASSPFWHRYLLYSNQTPFSDTDPIFDKNAGFYVFTLPFLKLAVGYWWALILLSIAIVVALYVLQYLRAAAIRVGKQEILNRAITHLSVLGLVLAANLALTVRFWTWDLLHSTRGAVIGAGATDVNVQIGVNNAFLVILALCAVLFVISAIVRSLRLTAWFAGSAVILGAAYLLIAVVIWPAIYQHFWVSPNEVSYERPFIQHNIDFTRKAYGLSAVTVKPFPVSDAPLTAESIHENQNTIDAIRIWDWRPLDATIQNTQGFRTYYRFADVDILRYRLGGKLTQVMASVRELDQDQLPARSQTWQNKRFVYTHGYGVCVTPVNGFTAEGLPEYVLKDIPPVSPYPELSLKRPEVYFGEITDSPVFVHTNHQEFDYPMGDTNVTCSYQGKGGIALGSGMRSLILALRFEGLRQLTASELNPGSRIMFRRSIAERVKTLAPFLEYDGDPYQVISDGRIWYIWDAYTCSDDYPYSQRTSSRGRPEVNYIRNSVKVVIDAYNGTVDFYVWDEADPIIGAYRSIYPTLFKTKEQMPAGLRQHVRYPEDLLSLQARIYSVYHMSDINVFYNKEDQYDVARENYHGREQQMLPYYAVMRIPGEATEEFVQMVVFTPHTTNTDNPKNNMVAWMAARCDGDNYGKLLVYEFPKDKLVMGPMQLEARISQHDVISKDLTLWNQQGSEVIQANLMVVPLNDFHLLLVKPIFLQATMGKMPELKRVIVASGDRLAYADTYQDALRELVGQPVISGSSLPESSGTPAVASPAAFLSEAAQCYQQYLKLTGEGKTVEAGRALEKLGVILQRNTGPNRR